MTYSNLDSIIFDEFGRIDCNFPNCDDEFNVFPVGILSLFKGESVSVDIILKF